MTTLEWKQDGDRWRAEIPAEDREIAAWEEDDGGEVGSVLVTLCHGASVAYTEPYDAAGEIGSGAEASSAQYDVDEPVSFDPGWASETWLLYAVFVGSPLAREGVWRRAAKRFHRTTGATTSLRAGEALWGVFLFDAESLEHAKARAEAYAEALRGGAEDSGEFFERLTMQGHWAVAFPLG